jgi:hypothetical protein
MRAPTAQWLVAAVFEQDRYARSALRMLYETGFSLRQVGYIARHGELLEAAGALRAVDAPEHDLAGGLIGFGVPVPAARELSEQFDHGCSIITVLSPGQTPVVEHELYLAGAVDVSKWEVGALGRWRIDPD